MLKIYAIAIQQEMEEYLIIERISITKEDDGYMHHTKYYWQPEYSDTINMSDYVELHNLSMTILSLITVINENPSWWVFKFIICTISLLWIISWCYLLMVMFYY